MGIQVIGVVGAVLVKPDRGSHLRNGRPHNGGKLQQIRPGDQGQQLAQLLKYPLPGQAVQPPGLIVHGPPGFRLHGQTVTNGKADAPENPQGILPEPFFRCSHRPEDFIFQILPPAEGVGKPPCGGIGHGIDGKIPPGQILLHIPHEAHPVRMPAVPVIPLGAEGGDLHHARVGADAHGAVLLPCQHQSLPGKHLFHLLRQGGGAKVKVRRGQSQQGIPDAAPYHIGGKPMVFQGVQDGYNGLG